MNSLTLCISTVDEHNLHFRQCPTDVVVNILGLWSYARKAPSPLRGSTSMLRVATSADMPARRSVRLPTSDTAAGIFDDVERSVRAHAAGEGHDAASHY